MMTPARPFLPVSAAQYPIGRPGRFEAYVEKIEEWVADARAAHDTGLGPPLLVFPEYGALELASIHGAETEADPERQIDVLTGHAAEVDGLHAALAQRHDAFILAASLPFRLSAGRVVNRARLFTPDGRCGHQDKQVTTRFERERWHVAGSPGLTLFDTPIARIGVAICYDVEFPLIGRAFAEAGAQVILAPSCTDTLAGANRVRTGALARALENQLAVVVSPTVGLAAWNPAVDVNRGRAGIYGPAQDGFSDHGILAEGRLDEPGWVHGLVELDRIAALRTDGDVLPFRHWAEQPGANTLALPTVRTVRLGHAEDETC